MTDPKHSKAGEVFNQLKGLPTSGIIAQKSTGLVYLHIDDHFILKALEVLQTDSYIILYFPPTPILVDNMILFMEVVPHFVML